MNNRRFTFLAGVTLLTVLARWLPHPPNFTPVAALALFGGAHFGSKRAAFLVPLTAMFLSDLVLGLHSLLPVVYACFALNVCLGLWLRSRLSGVMIATASLAGAVVFYAVTNFAVWVGSSFYPQTLAGLMDCYVAALPFFGNAVAGDLTYTALLFGLIWAAERRWPVLRPVLERATK